MQCMMIAVVVGLMSGGAIPSLAKPLKVFILAGQSNMQGHANVSTLDSMADDPRTSPILKEIRNTDGTPRVCEKVWISSVGCAGDGWSDVIEQTGRLTAGFGASPAEIGPEFTFGIYTEKRLGEPILLIKASWGGRSLHTDFRPPSAGPETFNDYIVSQWKQRGLDVNEESEKILKNGGVFYHHMIEHVKMVLADIKRVAPDYDPQQGYELAGFVWFQGWNDMVDSWTYNNRMKPGGYDLYGQLLAQFIRDVRKDLSAPKLPFVIGVMGVGGVKEGEKPPQMYFRQAQTAPASLPEFQGNVVAVQTASYWDDDLDALQQRMEKFNAKMDREFKEDPSLSREARDEVRKKAMAETFTPEELKRLKGISNGGYHYLGAAKILAPIGKAFAEAIIGMTRADGRLGEVVTIPAGSFLMGNNGHEGFGRPEEFPQHRVNLPTYQIGKYEVTRGQYRRFIEAGGYEDPRYWSAEGWKWKQANELIYAGMNGTFNRVARPAPQEERRAPERWAPEQEWIGHGLGHPRFMQTDQHPVVGVTYYEAEAYCKWAGGRLPTEAEWEKAARWDEEQQRARTWPWGDTWDPEKCNNPEDHHPAGGGYRVNQSAPAGTYPSGVSPYGCLDMVGNAWEWVASRSRSHPGSPAPFDHTDAYRLVKGGCWDDGPAGVRCSSRIWYLPLGSSGTGPGDSDYIGFRVAR